ncbi:MAG: phosphate signaling complex protein PhoU [Bacteroidales bacterium]|jgi:phosphate transport system protein|nr:phosphate signaling complex protein PhoU [Bacteroidales bacterium]
MENNKLKHTDRELILLKEEISEMWKLVLSQLEKSKQAYLNKDVELAREVISREKRVDAFELKIDSDCENYIALYSPVAVDLRLILSMIKICTTLERIGDYAKGVAKHVIKDDCLQTDPALIEDLQIETAFDTVISMLVDSFVAFESENTKLSGKIIAKDELVDELYHKSIYTIAEYIRKNAPMTECCLKTLLLMRKLERIGDHCSNIVEEIVFYIDAKVLKHAKKNVNNIKE